MINLITINFLGYLKGILDLKKDMTEVLKYVICN